MSRTSSINSEGLPNLGFAAYSNESLLQRPGAEAHQRPENRWRKSSAHRGPVAYEHCFFSFCAVHGSKQPEDILLLRWCKATTRELLGLWEDWEDRSFLFFHMKIKKIVLPGPGRCNMLFFSRMVLDLQETTMNPYEFILKSSKINNNTSKSVEICLEFQDPGANDWTKPTTSLPKRKAA